MRNQGKFDGSQRPSPTTHSVMPTVAPVPAATMRSGRVGDAPWNETRTGRIDCTPAPGTSFIAGKSEPCCTYAAMTGSMSGVIA